MPNPRKRPGNPPPRWRQHLIVAALLAGFAGLGWRVVHLSTAEQAHLRAQGDARHLRQLAVAPQRGRILDRDGRVLAVSTPVESLWANPAVFCAADARAMWQPLLARIDRSAAQLAAACARRADAGFMYIQRRLPPFLAQDLMRLGVPGLALQREYKRFYPGGPAGAQLIGFTDVDDAGQEGLEAAHDASLSGAPGRIRVLKDRAGNYVESVESIRQVRHGKDLTLSIDQRLQALAGDYLEAAVRAHDAAGGSVVALAVPSGEIMAMVNSPQFNPNDRRTITGGAFRNRSVTDVLEPGSTLKPFTAAMALESGAFDSRSLVDSAPGRISVGGHTITEARDHNYGELSLADVVVKSSNVGVTKIALQLPYDELYDALSAAGFGRHRPPGAHRAVPHRRQNRHHPQVGRRRIPRAAIPVGVHRLRAAQPAEVRGGGGSGRTARQIPLRRRCRGAGVRQTDRGLDAPVPHRAGCVAGRGRDRGDRSNRGRRGRRMRSADRLGAMASPSQVISLNCFFISAQRT